MVEKTMALREKPNALMTTAAMLQERAESMSITSPEQMEEAVALLSELNKANDRIDEEKQKVLRPLLDATNAERARWKPAETHLAAGIAFLRRLITDHQTAKRAEEAAQAAAIAARIAPGKGNLSLETGVAKIDAIEKAPEKVATASGAVSFRTVPKWRVIDESKIPGEFMVPNEALINAEMKAGNSIPGIEYYTEEQVINKR